MSAAALVLAAIAGTLIKSPPKHADHHRVMEPPPIQVLVSKHAIADGHVRYNYRVINGSAFPVTTLSIGENYYLGTMELSVAPVGFGENGVPSTSVTSPTGWTFRAVGAEEDSMGLVEWEIEGHTNSIAGGSSLAGFSVLVPRASVPYEHSHWTVYLNSAEQPYYAWTLQPDADSSVPASSVDAPNGIHIGPIPTRESARIDFDVPGGGEVSVCVFDAQGRAVRELLGRKVEAGPTSATWDGRDAAGASMPPGVYFVRIKTPTTERFSKFTRVK